MAAASFKQLVDSTSSTSGSSSSNQQHNKTCNATAQKLLVCERHRKGAAACSVWLNRYTLKHTCAAQMCTLLQTKFECCGGESATTFTQDAQLLAAVAANR
jgi:hypothetical protein